MNWISLGDALKAMRSFDERGKPKKFDLEVISLDKKKGNDGRVLRFQNAIVSGLRKQSKSLIHKDKMESLSGIQKDPSHAENLTLNVFCKEDLQVRKIHLFLITRFNGLKVI